MLSAPSRIPVHVVAEGVGQTVAPDGAWSKSRFWLMNDQTCVWAFVDASGSFQRRSVAVTSASFGGGRAKIYTDQGVYDFTKAPCSCGMGVVASAQPVDGRIEIIRVAPPAWVSGL